MVPRSVFLLLSIAITVSKCHQESKVNNVGRDVRDQILKWWKEMSVQKPLKCKLNDEFVEPFPPVVYERFIQPKVVPRLVQSRPCAEKEEPIAFDFRGKGGQVIDGRFEGPGKLRILKKPPIDKEEKPTEEEEKAKVCLTRGKYTGQYANEFVGTFKNGTLEGPGRIVLEDGSSLISHFKNGMPSGIVRLFDGTGNLVDLYYEDVLRKGYMWIARNGYLIYSNQGIYNGLENPAENPDSLILKIDGNTDEEVWVGKFNIVLGLMENVHKGAHFKVDDSACSLRVTWTLGEKQDFIHFYKNHTKVPLHVEDRCQQILDEPNQTVIQQFDKWIRYVYYPMKHGVGGFVHLYRLKPLNDPVDFKAVRQPFMSNFSLEFESNAITPKFSLWNGPRNNWTATTVQVDDQLRPHGSCVFELRVHEYNNTGRHEFLNWSLKTIYGTFVHGKLQGLAVLATWQGQYLFANFVDNVLHGPAFLSGVVPILEADSLRGFRLSGRQRTQDYTNLIPHSGAGFLGWMKNGQVHGDFWAEMVNMGYMHGQADDKGLMTGDKLAYIYPDGETALFGRFENKFMKKAYGVDVQAYECKNGLMVAEKFGPPLSDHAFYFEPCTNESFGGGAPLHIRDPYEVKTVKLAPSSVPNSGEGVFVIRDVPKGQFASLYSLFLYRHPDQSNIYHDTCMDNTSKSDEYRRHCKKYSLGIAYYGGTIDVPPEFDVNPLPNLGPKVNHHFRANNSVYAETEHPRYGLIQSVTPMRDMKAGEELHTYYGYKGPAKFPADFQWYFEAERNLIRQERLEREKLEMEKKKLEQSKVEKKKKKSKTSKKGSGGSKKKPATGVKDKP